MSALTKIDDRIDGVVFAIRNAVEASMRNIDKEVTVAEDQAWGYVRQQLFRLVEEILPEVKP